MAGALFLLLFSPAESRAQGAACDDAADIAVLPSPMVPWRGAPLRVIFTVEKALDGELSLIAPDGSVATRSRERRGGPPYFWLADIPSPAPGTWRASLNTSRCGTITREIAVRAEQPPRPGTAAGSVWPLRGSWNRATENLDSAWIERLFEAPIGEELSWPALHVGLRDRSRNYPVQPSRSRRRRDQDGAAPRLRGPAVFPARLLRIQARTAGRLFEMHARRRRTRAILRRLHQHSGFHAASRTIAAAGHCAIRAGDADRDTAPPAEFDLGRSGNTPRPSAIRSIPAQREPRSPTTTPTTTPCRSARRRCGQAVSTPIRTGTSWCW